MPLDQVDADFLPTDQTQRTVEVVFDASGTRRLGTACLPRPARPASLRKRFLFRFDDTLEAHAFQQRFAVERAEREGQLGEP